MNVTFFAYPDPVVWWQVILALLGQAVGAFCAGCVGTGGVLWVPMLMMLPKMEAKVAIGSTFVAVFFCNLMKTYVWHRAGKILWKRSMDFAIPAIPGALCGAVLVPYLPSTILAIGVSALCLLSSLQLAKQSYVTYKRKRSAGQAQTGAQQEQAEMEEIMNKEPSMDAISEIGLPEEDEACKPIEEQPADEAVQEQIQINTEPHDESSVQQGYYHMSHDPGADGLTGTAKRQYAIRYILGFIVSFLSAITGTGGPVILFPIFFLIYPDTPPHLLCGTVIPFVIALSLSSTVGAVFFGSLDIGISLVMTINCGFFITLGSKLAMRLSPDIMKVMLAAVLFLTAVGTGTKHALEVA
eukprot:TRINITY_DN6764_c0_g1_i1.p1 TRINITY_DN6764_c0_g1~~TRINITY_DN6764_c0_g1_i1.p1  ORF type:complete len:354 (+),score=33.17 TRINITY_DN6764_c0_g1_i1:424-1485(+)